MEQRLLFSLMILMSCLTYSQVQGPPPPCGINGAYECDDNRDGFEVFNLVELFPFSTFCMSLTEDENDYNSIFYYSSEEDMNNEINPIVNAEAYTNTSSHQIIYYRANAIVSGGTFEFLSSNDNFIEVLQKPTPNLDNSLIVCNTNNTGLSVFDLTSSEEGILAGLSRNIYFLDYYETLNDAENNTNKIINSTEYFANSLILYVRVNYIVDQNCYAIVELDLIVQETCEDIEVHLVSYRSPRPGFDYRNFIIVKNRGSNVIASGQVEFIHDSLLEFIDVNGVDSGNSITNTPTGFILNFSNLQPANEERVLIRMKTPASNSLGTLLTNKADYLGTDVNSSNNTSILNETVIGSYDPNDIVESHGPEILHSSFENTDYLYYTVRFQNVGTAEAINISIDNTLDSRLDKSTIQMLTSSHDNEFTRINNQLNWKFDNINLSSESMDELNSHGYVYYKIKPFSGYKVGDIIPNTAEIYFDFNLAIVTNTFNTEFITTLSNNEIFNKPKFSIFPNPATNFVELIFNKTGGNLLDVNIYDIQGKQILNSKNQLQNNRTQINVSELKSGMYFLKVNSGIDSFAQKIIIK